MTTPKNTTAINSREFRNVMGLFATGVTVVATEIDGEIYGMTANAITSVSLDPMLILVCVQKEAHMAQYLQKTRQFSINILNQEQQDLSNFFAGLWPEGAAPPPFSFEPWVGGPRLTGATGALACKVDEFLEGGDHWIVTGLVIDLYSPGNPARNPLLFYRGKYRKILDEE